MKVKLMSNFASIQDVTDLWRALTPEERIRCEALLETVSASLRYEAYKVGKDLDVMISENEALKEVAKSVTVDVAARTLMTSTDAEPMTQMSQSALGYSVSGTYLVPGGGLFIKRSELARLGLRRQKYGVIDLWESSEG
jgi:hypothetical protein